MKLLFVELQETTELVAGSSTISYVLQRKGGGPFTFDNGVGLGLGLGFEPFPATEVVAESMISPETQSIGESRVYELNAERTSRREVGSPRKVEKMMG